MIKNFVPLLTLFTASLMARPELNPHTSAHTDAVWRRTYCSDINPMLTTEYVAKPAWWTKLTNVTMRYLERPAGTVPPDLIPGILTASPMIGGDRRMGSVQAPV